MKISLKTQPLLAIGILLLVATLASADTIYLKNGMYIVVTKAVDKGGEVEYWVGSTKYTISKDLVAKIESGNRAPSNHSAAPMNGASAVQDLTRREGAGSAGAVSRREKLQLPAPGGPKQQEPYWSALRARITQGDRVNETRLAEIELDNDARTTSNAYFLAGVTEMQSGDSAKASVYFENALRATPEQANLLEWHAVALSAQGNYAEAVHELERATALEPGSPHLLQLLGLARYDADRTSEAVTAWKQAVELAPDPYTEKLLHKAERELEVEERSRSRQSAHFTLHYQGDATSAELQQQLLATLEESYRDLASQLSLSACREHHRHSLHPKGIR